MRKMILILLFWVFSLHAGFVPHPENVENKTPHTLSLAALFSNEAKWLKEWIEFHRLVGVDHFYLFNNNSQDHYLKVLKPYISEGVVELFDCVLPDDLFPTHLHFALNYARDKTEWLAFADTKEFYTPIEVGNLKELLEIYHNAHGIYLLWHVFGTSNIKYLKLNELLIEKLRYRAPAIDYVNRFGRMIVKPSHCVSVKNKHFCTHVEGSILKTVPVEMARINHYFVRTEGYFKGMQVFRFGDSPLEKPESKRELVKYMPRANSVEDHTMEPFVNKVKQRIFK